ncbi:hypothetical protein F0U59_38700 [Archangium gephyra]|nr:hypothetical protein F0U59_38700 [Archangium gephyra]
MNQTGFLGLGLKQAVSLVNHLLTLRVRQFEHVRATELPALLDHLEVDAETRAAVDAYVGSLQDVMAGVLDGHQAIGRWRDETPSALQSAAMRQGRAGLRTLPGLLPVLCAARGTAPWRHRIHLPKRGSGPRRLRHRAHVPPPHGPGHGRGAPLRGFTAASETMTPPTQ